MAQALRHDLGVDVLLKEHRCVRVAQIMKPHAQIETVRKPVERLGEGVWGTGAPVGPGDNEVEVLIRVPQCPSYLCLAAAVLSQRPRYARWERDTSAGFRCLGLLEGQLPTAAFYERLPDSERLGFEVDVLPAQSQEFPSANAGGDRDK